MTNVVEAHITQYVDLCEEIREYSKKNSKVNMSRKASLRNFKLEVQGAMNDENNFPRKESSIDERKVAQKLNEKAKKQANGSLSFI